MGEWGVMTMRMRRRSVVWLLVVVAIAGSVGHRNGNGAVAQPSQQSLVRLLHLAPDAPPIDVYVDGQLVVRRAEFPSATGFLPFSAGEHRFQVTPTGSTMDGVLVDIEQNLDDGVTYEIAVIGLLNDLEGAVYEVDLGEIADPGLARLRTIHVAPHAGSLDVANGGGELVFEDLEFPEAGEYREVAAAPTDLVIRPTAEVTDLARLDGLPIQPGWTYDVFVVGQRENATLQFFAVKAPTVAPCGTVLQVEPIDAVCGRVVHAAVEVGPLWVFLDDGAGPVAGPIEVGEAAPFVALPAGEHRLRFTPDQGGQGEVVAEVVVDAGAGGAVTVFVVPGEDGVVARVEAVDLGSLSEGQARVRITHAIAESGPIDVVLDDGTLLAEDLTVGETSEDVAVPGQALALSPTASGGDGVLLAPLDISLEPGLGYEVVIIGQPDQPQPVLLVVGHATVSMAEREGVERPADAGATPAASPEIVPTPSPTAAG